MLVLGLALVLMLAYFTLLVYNMLEHRCGLRGVYTCVRSFLVS